MAVLHDFECAGHGAFEARVKPGKLPKCPHGCPPAFVKLVFNRAPAHMSNSTKFQDSAIKGLARDFGLTDVRNDKEGGTSVMDNIRHAKTPEELGAPRFMEIPHAKPGWTQRGETATTVDPSAAIGGAQVQGENAMFKIPAPRANIPKELTYRPGTLPDAP